MTAKHTNTHQRRGAFYTTLFPSKLRLKPALVAFASFLAVLVFIASGLGVSDTAGLEELEFEVGRVAERDVMAERFVRYIDEEATRLRREAQERLVPAVFSYSSENTKDTLASYERFSNLVKKTLGEGTSAESFKLAIQAEFPGAFSQELLDTFFRNPSRERFLEYGAQVIKILMEEGVFALPKADLRNYNPDFVEVFRLTGGRKERERISFSRLVSLESLSQRIMQICSSGSYPSAFSSLATGLINPFITENIFFSTEETKARLEAERAQVIPVVKDIERGTRVIRKGFIVTQEDMVILKALNQAQVASSPGHTIGIILMLSLLYAILVFLVGSRVVGNSPSPGEVYLISIISASYVIGSVFANTAVAHLEYFPAALLLPTALVVMLPAVFMGPRVASAMAIVLPLTAFAAGSLDVGSFLFALVSGIAGAYALQGAQRRMDLIKAGFIIAIVHILSATAVLLLQQAPASLFPVVLFWAAFNGMACGMLVLGCLPIFEQMLNSATPFRLIELADLNSPMLKRLLTVAPGTYSHSVTVANLAESACREIGANALLVRVGAYYHDIGKMDQPGYFIENQGAYNKHDDLAPRLSATVIRSHVKLGVEKARQLKLPQQVVDIIAEHHGNSVISWFYNEALKREDQVAVDDFSYPGSPPRSKESAVVMLADTVEAAVRTLKKPTMARIEKFVQELIMSKFDQGQLSESELSFRDLEAIKNAFVRVLAGHYHSRIEYPKAVPEVYS